MGFNGKQIIHPGQIEVTQQAYTPHKDKIEWAIGLIQAFDEHQKSGAVSFLTILGNLYCNLYIFLKIC